MRICDKCKKTLREGDGNSHIDLGYAFTYDLCAKCEEKFLLHVNSFFNKKESRGIQMSELKATTAQEIVRNEKDCDYMDELFGGVKMPPTQVYLKSEADNVIAELKERIDELEKENESLKYSVAALETDLAMAERWRKVSEELPKDGETVLVLLGRTPKTRGFFLTSRYVAGGWTYGEDPQGCKPTHWFRIPKAPEVK